ncbi:MAG: hypothetical protein IIX19_06580 [Alistipes sp.]|nr:hypothetical protein [Alistipes sp.]
MKKLLLFLMATMLLGVSCQQNEFSELNMKNGTSVTLKIDVPELTDTRSGETDMNSGLGAIDNFTADEWAKYDVRYIMEIYDATDGYVNLNEPIKKRDVKTLDEYAETMFDVRLVPQRTYRFVIWADFVEQGSKEDLSYNTSDLNNITRKEVVAMDECQDAYFICKDLFVGNEGISESLTLKRPFGKIRVITTDHNEVNIGSEPEKVEVKFYNHTLYTSLNAVTGQATGETVNEYTYTLTKESTPYTQGYDASIQNLTLFSDYILAGDFEEEGAQEVNFTVKVWGKDGREIKTNDFSTQIPLGRNHLTTIVGNLLTLQNNINIVIDDKFDGEYIRNTEVSDTTITNWAYGKLNANNNYEFELSDNQNTFSVIVAKSAIEDGKLKIGEYAFVANEALLQDNTFTINNLMVATRSSVEAIIKQGSMSIAEGENGGAVATLDLYYATSAEDTEYDYIRLCFTSNESIAVKERIATPNVESKIEGNVVTLWWTAVENAASYSVANGEQEPVIIETTSYVFTGEYDTEYTFSIMALANDTTKYYESEAKVVVVTTEAEPVADDVILYFSAPHWEVDGARFAIYYWNDSTQNWADLHLAEGESAIYTTTIPGGYSNVIFCRMNPAGDNNWNNKWNQTTDLTIPTNGNNLFTVNNNAWDSATGTWSLYTKSEKVETTSTLTFDNKAKRTAFSSASQTWEENGITFVNDKSQSTSAVADYAKPARCYANSKITVSTEGEISKIVFDCNSTSYATTLKNSIGSSATVSSDKVTVVLNGQESFVINKLTAQVRLDAVTVTYMK